MDAGTSWPGAPSGVNHPPIESGTVVVPPMSLQSPTPARRSPPSPRIGGVAHGAALDAWQIPGAQIGRYKVLRQLAAGGMAEVFLAETNSMHGVKRRVVLKRISPSLVDDPTYEAMFLDEIRVAALLNHPNIVQMFEVEAFRGSSFYAMEYVHGKSLLDILRVLHATKQHLPLEHVVGIIIDVCAALHYAHERADLDGAALRIIHRDISPSNVMVRYDGFVKLMDFGVARFSTKRTQTKAGERKGKVAYMSPEQALTGPLDRRTDIFSLGIVLYELLTAKKLFKGKNDVVVLNKICTGDVPSPSALRPDCPAELETIVMRALALDPSHRYATALEFQLALEHFARVFQLPVSPSGRAHAMSVLFGRDSGRRTLASHAIVHAPRQPTPPTTQPPPPPSADDVIDLDSLELVDLDNLLED